MNGQVENRKLRNQIADLEARNKRLEDEVAKKNNDFMVSRGDSEKLKVEFFSRIRDSLAQKLEEFKPKQQPQGVDIFDSA